MKVSTGFALSEVVVSLALVSLTAAAIAALGSRSASHGALAVKELQQIEETLYRTGPASPSASCHPITRTALQCSEPDSFSKKIAPALLLPARSRTR